MLINLKIAREHPRNLSMDLCTMTSKWVQRSEYIDFNALKSSSRESSRSSNRWIRRLIISDHAKMVCMVVLPRVLLDNVLRALSDVLNLTHGGVTIGFKFFELNLRISST